MGADGQRGCSQGMIWPSIFKLCLLENTAFPDVLRRLRNMLLRNMLLRNMLLQLMGCKQKCRSMHRPPQQMETSR